MDIAKKSIELHQTNKGKMEIKLKVPLENKADLSLAYTPGVAEVCKQINLDPEKVDQLTNRANTVAVVTDGSAVLGLGNIGPKAALPVMEGKAVLFKRFAGVDAIPLCLATQDVDEIVTIVKNLEPTFGGINLEDISAPRCFEIENKLKETMKIPVFHDDQHGTAIVVLAGLINALKLVNKKLENIKVVVNGAGAAGLAITKILINSGVREIVVLDSVGALCLGRENMNWAKEEIAKITNKGKCQGGLENVLDKADVFIGVSVANVLNPEWVKKMNPAPIIFAMANPVPEIDPQAAKDAGASIVATGRSDYPNQINNVLAFPGVFRGAIDSGVKKITEEMKINAAFALASVIPENELNKDYIVPDAFNENVVKAISQVIKKD